jgi:hypothetical protein
LLLESKEFRRGDDGAEMIAVQAVLGRGTHLLRREVAGNLVAEKGKVDMGRRGLTFFAAEDT